MAAERKLVLFDFDGTITDRDTMLGFARHCRGPLRFWAGMVWLLPLFVGLRLGLVPPTDAKRLFLRHFLGGMDRATLQQQAELFADHVERYVRPQARAQLRRHREQGDEVAVVSASLDLWLGPFMRIHELRCLCTEADFTPEDRFEGELASPNCNGPEKARRIREVFDLSSYGSVIAYGDSSGDREMLALADEAIYRPFRGEGSARQPETEGLPTA